MRAKLIRVLVVGLLLLTLPLQGWARLNMTVCHDSEFERASTLMPCHHRAAHEMPNDTTATASLAAEHSAAAGDHHSKISCSVCAPCCAGIAFNNTLLTISIIDIQRSATTISPVLFTSHLYPPLDRPPRTI